MGYGDKMTTPIEFGERLKKLMMLRNYNNTRLTEELHVSKNAVGNYLNNQIPNAMILLKISQILGTSMEYLLTGKEYNELTYEETELVQAYRVAAPAMQEAVRKLLELDDKSKSSDCQIGKKIG